jgi:hypothetical protein
MRILKLTALPRKPHYKYEQAGQQPAPLMNFVNFFAGGVTHTIKGLRCSDGGCLENQKSIN